MLLRHGDQWHTRLSLGMSVGPDKLNLRLFSWEDTKADIVSELRGGGQLLSHYITSLISFTMSSRPPISSSGGCFGRKPSENSRQDSASKLSRWIVSPTPAGLNLPPTDYPPCSTTESCHIRAPIISIHFILLNTGLWLDPYTRPRTVFFMGEFQILTPSLIAQVPSTSVVLLYFLQLAGKLASAF